MLPYKPIARPERARAVGFGAGRDVGERGARLRLGEAHGPHRASRQHRSHERIDLGLGTVSEQQVGVADREQRIARGRGVRGAEPGEGRLVDDHRQLHAAQLVVAGRGEQPCIGKCSERRLDLRQQPDALAVDDRFLEIRFAPVRKKALHGDPLGGGKHRIERLARVIGESRSRAEPLDIQPLVEQEFEVPA